MQQIKEVKESSKNVKLESRIHMLQNLIESNTIGQENVFTICVNLVQF